MSDALEGTNDPLSRPEPDELVVIVGETGSGKTALALDLARAWGGEIVGADSVQIYRGFDVGSGKPTAAELGDVRHHLIDVVEPDAPFDAGAFVRHADAAIAEIRARGAVPIVCGGTYLWVKALLFGLASAPSAAPELRLRLQNEAKSLGSPALHARLVEVDPTTAARLHPNDATRIIRGLEVFETTGTTLAHFQAQHGFREPRHRARVVAIAHERLEIERRIAARVADMLARGWVDEVAGLLARGFGGVRAMAAVGYAEVKRHLEGAVTADELPIVITRATRIFARRQRTWLAQANVRWVPSARVASYADRLTASESPTREGAPSPSPPTTRG